MKRLLYTFVTIVLGIILLCDCSKESLIIDFNGGPDLFSLESKGGSGSINFNSNSAWSASSSAEWLVVSPTSGKAGDNITVNFSAKANTDYDQRSANIVISAGSSSLTATVTQARRL